MAATGNAASGGSRTTPSGWRMMVIPALVLVGLFNYLDRALPAVLAEPIKRELALSDTALGFINGLGFLLVYAIAGVPIARVADRGRYSGVITLSLAIWSFMTLLGGLVTSAWQLAVTRMGVALGEAGSLPASHAYITRHFPPRHRALTLSMLSMSVPLGNSVGLLVGGALGEAFGWRGALFAMGGIGLALAPMVLLVLNRGVGVSGGDTTPQAAARSGTPPLISLDRTGRAIAPILLGSSLIAVGGYASIAFTPAFLMRVHGLDLQTVGLRFGLASGVAGIVALLLTGWFTDRLGAQRGSTALLVVASMICLVLPFSIATFRVTDPALALGLAAVGSIVPVAYLAPVISSLHRLVPESARAQTSALLLLCTAVLGGLGPLAVGLLSDALQSAHGAHSLALAMLVIPASYALAAVSFVVAARETPTYRET